MTRYFVDNAKTKASKGTIQVNALNSRPTDNL